MSIITAGTLHAMATIDGTLAAFLAGSKAPGFFNITKAGVGLCELTLDQAADETQCVIFATPRSAGPIASCQTVHVSDCCKRVQTYAGGVLADVAFDILVTRMPSL